MKKNLNMALVFSVFAYILLLSGCDWPKTGDTFSGSDDTLLKIDGKTVITKESFYKEVSPMLQGMDPAMLPKETQRKVLDDMMRLKLFVAAAKKEGLDKDKEYINAFEEQKERLEELLLSRFYEKSVFDKVKVSDADISADYESNQSKYVKDRAGVLVSGVSFKNKDKALAFYNKIKNQIDDFASIGKKDKDGKFREFGRVSSEAGDYGMAVVPKAVKDAALNLTKLPSVDVVKEGKETWVIHVSDKKEASFYDLDEIRDRIEYQLKVNKFMELRNTKQDELKNDFKIEVNETYFKEEAKPEMTQKDNNNDSGGEIL